MSDLRGAIIGCGFFARNHLNAWNDVVGAGLVAVCDLDLAKAEAAAALTGAKPYTDAGAMLAAERLDFVDIATTMESHEALMALAADHKIAAICQKPFAPDLAAVRRILARADASGRPIMVHENFRFQTPLIAAQKVVASGAIGKPFFAHISWRTGYDVVAGQPYLAETKRFIILDLGIHVLDIARFIMGEVREIYARTQRTMPVAIGESQATMLLEHTDGALSEVVCTYTNRIEPDPFPQTLIEVDGEAGSLRLLRDYRLEIHRPGEVEVREVPPGRPSWADPRWALAQESVLTTQQHWVDCLREGREPMTSGRDNLKTFALVEAAYASAASGQPAVPEA